MAANGFFTIDDLYAGKAREYHYRRNTPQLPLNIETGWSQIFPVVENSTSTKQKLSGINLSKNFETNNLTFQPISLGSFTYVHWVLISFAIVLVLTLKLLAIYYCCRYYHKGRKIRENKKKQALPNIYQYRSSQGSTPLFNIYQSTKPCLFSSPKRSKSSKSPDSLNSELLRKGLDAVGTPQSVRNQETTREQTNSFTSTASDLLTEIKDRLSTRSCKSTLVNTSNTSETQSANLELSDESKSIS